MNKPPNQTGKHWKLSSETRLKQSLARTGIKLSIQHRKKLSLSHIGLKYPNRKKVGRFSITHRQNISKSLKGKNCFWYGKKHSDDVKNKISKSKRGVKLSLITRYRMSQSRKGKKNNSWKGGITPYNSLLRRTIEYKLWRESVFKRDDWTCVFCGIKSGKGVKVFLHADHIKRFADYPNLRFDINNGRTLCKDCHKNTDTYGGKKQKYVHSI